MMIKRSNIKAEIDAYLNKLSPIQRLFREATPLRALRAFINEGHADAELSAEELTRLVLNIEQGLYYFTFDKNLTSLFRKLKNEFALKEEHPLGYTVINFFWIYLTLAKKSLLTPANLALIHAFPGSEINNINYLLFSASEHFKNIVHAIKEFADDYVPSFMESLGFRAANLSRAEELRNNCITPGLQNAFNQTILEALLLPIENYEKRRPFSRRFDIYKSTRYDDISLLFRVFDKFKPPANYIDYFNTKLINRAGSLEDILKQLYTISPQLLTKSYPLVLKLLCNNVDTDTRTLPSLLSNFHPEDSSLSELWTNINSNPLFLEAGIILNDISFRFFKENLLSLQEYVEHARELARAYANLSAYPQVLIDYRSDLLTNPLVAEKLTRAYAILFKTNPQLLTDYRADMLANPERTGELAHAYTELYKTNPQLLLDYRADLLANPKKEIQLSYAYIELVQTSAELLTDYRTDLLANPEKAEILAKAYAFTHKLSPELLIEYHDDLLDNSDPLVLVYCIFSLFKGAEGLLNLENYCRIKSHINDYPLSSVVLAKLASNNLLNQAEFDLVIQYANILSDEAFFNCIFGENELIPLLNKEAFDTIIAICEHAMAAPGEVIDAPRRALQLLMEWHDDEMLALRENAQSTHIASVHKSCSESAIRLKASYAVNIASRDLITAKLEELETWIYGLDQSLPKIQAAKRLIANIKLTTINSCGNYKDPVSNVSIREMLVLFWCAINDETKRKTSLDEARLSIIEALYESERGYNLSELFIDDGRETDGRICAMGTFNKLIEYLSIHHTEAELIVITQTGAAAKFKILIQEKAFAYLNTLEADELRTKIEVISAAENLQSITEVIKDAVITELLEEYGSLYPEGENDAKIISLLSQIEHINLEPANLATLMRKLNTLETPITVTTMGLFTAQAVVHDIVDTATLVPTI